MIKNRKYSVVTPACQQPEVVFQEEVLSFAKTLFIMDRTENDYSAFEKRWMSRGFTGKFRISREYACG